MTWTIKGTASPDEVLIILTSLVGLWLTVTMLRLRLADVRVAPDEESRYVARRKVYTHFGGLVYHLLMLGNGAVRSKEARTPDLSPEVTIALYLLPVASMAVLSMTANDWDIRRGVRRIRERLRRNLHG